MNTRNTLTAVLAACALLLSGCGAYGFNMQRGSGVLTSESREVSGLSDVTLAGVGDLTISQGEVEALTIEAEDNVLPYIRSEVQNGRLTISLRGSGWFNNDGPGIVPTKPIHYDLKVRSLNSLQLSGAGRVTSAALKTGALRVAVTGAGNLDLGALAAESLDVTLSGAGTVKVAGAVTRQNVTITGVGNYRAEELLSGETQATISGAGNATVNAREHLNAAISGTGDIRYLGSPTVTQRITGAGKIGPFAGR